jgi:hypothetical protein
MSMAIGSSNYGDDAGRESLSLLRELIEQVRLQTAHLVAMRAGNELDVCLLDKIGRIVCNLANETHAQTVQLRTLTDAFQSLLELYRAVHPDHALQLERIEQVRAELRKCCPPSAPKPEPICIYEPCAPHGGFQPGEGYSVKSRGSVKPVPFDERPHEPWQIKPHGMHDDEILPQVPRGPLVGPLVPGFAMQRPLDFRVGPGPGGEARRSRSPSAPSPGAASRPASGRPT